MEFVIQFGWVCYTCKRREVEKERVSVQLMQGTKWRMKKKEEEEEEEEPIVGLTFKWVNVGPNGLKTLGL